MFDGAILFKKKGNFRNFSKHLPLGKIAWGQGCCQTNPSIEPPRAKFFVVVVLWLAFGRLWIGYVIRTKHLPSDGWIYVHPYVGQSLVVIYDPLCPLPTIEIGWGFQCNS